MGKMCGGNNMGALSWGSLITNEAHIFFFKSKGCGTEQR